MQRCTKCGGEVFPSNGGLGGVYPRCGPCRRSLEGWKPWHEKTLEEKVEDLNARLEELDEGRR